MPDSTQDLLDLINRLEIPPHELDRLIRVSSYKPSHSGPKMRCCGVFRCEPCHFDHLRTAHPDCAKFIMNNPAPTGSIYPKSTPGKLATKRKIKARARAQAKGLMSWQDLSDEEQEELYHELKAFLNGKDTV